MIIIRRCVLKTCDPRNSLKASHLRKVRGGGGDGGNARSLQLFRVPDSRLAALMGTNAVDADASADELCMSCELPAVAAAAHRAP